MATLLYQASNISVPSHQKEKFMQRKLTIFSSFFLLFSITPPAHSYSNLLFEPAAESVSNPSVSYTLAANTPPPKPRTNKKKSKRVSKKEVAKHIARTITSSHWRKNERNKIKEEVENHRWSSKSYGIIKEGLIAHEGGAHKGHTILKHVSVSKNTLLERIKQKKTDQSGKIDHKNIKAPAISSFKTLRKAEKFIDRTLQNTRIQTKINALLNSHKKTEVLELKNLGEITGLAIDPKTKKLVEVRGVTIIIKRDKNIPREWSIFTAYPSK